MAILNNASIGIQKLWRGHVARKMVKILKAKMKKKRRGKGKKGKGKKK